jgi:peptidoglycan biosynthesis protein MviN/MurJ (putative lipid II flippase)
LRGLALAITLGAWVELIVLIVLLERRIPAVRIAPLARGIATLVPGAALATLAAYAAQQWLDGPSPVDASKLTLAVQLLVPGIAAGAVFVAIAALLRLPELQTMRQILIALVTRRAAA